MYGGGFGNPYFNYQQQPSVDIGQVNNEQEAVNAYVQAGRSKIMFSADDKTVYVKCVGMNGAVSMDIFDRRQSEPQIPASEFVTKKELNEALEALKQTKEAAK